MSARRSGADSPNRQVEGCAEQSGRWSGIRRAACAAHHTCKLRRNAHESIANNFSYFAWGIPCGL